MKGKALFEVFMAFQGYLRVEEVLQVLLYSTCLLFETWEELFMS